MLNETFSLIFKHRAPIILSPPTMKEHLTDFDPIYRLVSYQEDYHQNTSRYQKMMVEQLMVVGAEG